MYRNKTIESTYCNMEVNCSICIIYQNLEIFLFGPVSYFDRKYEVQSDGFGNLMLVGSNSRMSKESGRWTLKSNVSQKILVNENSVLPLGRKNWTLIDCPKCYEKTVTLTFSSCLQNEFSCSNGQCISGQSARCNGVVQCSDASDEVDCVHILKDQGYQMKQMPSIKEIHDEKLMEVFHVAYSFHMKFVSEIFSSEGSLSLDFELLVRWSDSRLTFKNINSNNILDTDIYEPEFKYFATLTDGDAITDVVDEKTLTAHRIYYRNLISSSDDSYMGMFELKDP